MRFLSWVVAIACTCCVADAQQRGFDARSPDANRQLGRKTLRNQSRVRGGFTAPTNLRSLNFRGHVYHGRLAWEQGRWHHTTRAKVNSVGGGMSGVSGTSIRAD